MAIDTLVTLLIYVLVGGLIGYLLFYLIDLLPLPHPFGVIAKAIVVLIGIIILLRMLGMLPGLRVGSLSLIGLG